MKVLVTGGAGYIGSHTAVELLSCGYDVTVLDNLSNSDVAVIDKIQAISGKRVRFIKADICDGAALDKAFSSAAFDWVIHFAGLKAVGESCALPLKYYNNNVWGTVCLLEAMQKHNVKNIIFSSSATVYGEPQYLPYDEKHPLSPVNPYGRTKLFIEQILSDVCAADKEFTAVLLRYFNPVGAHPSTLIGENPSGIPNNLTPYIARVAAGKLDKLRVFGNDYPTRDGTGVRDYIHVVDLAKGHVAAMQRHNKKGLDVYNLGTGQGSSVLEVIAAFEAACGFKIPYEFTARREGDIAEFFANPQKANLALGWRAESDLYTMCRSLWEYTKTIK